MAPEEEIKAPFGTIVPITESKVLQTQLDVAVPGVFVELQQDTEITDPVITAKTVKHRRRRLIWPRTKKFFSRVCCA